MSEPVDLEIDAGRLLFGLSRIGYTTSSALCDIIDNAIRANAQNIRVIIKKERPDLSDTKRNNVKEYVVIDDGHGMNEEGIKKALKLGSPDIEYGINSLSKFGLGLKSAVFSQADILDVISSDGIGDFLKYRVSLPAVMELKKYFAEKLDLDDDDRALIQTLQTKKGTIVRLGKVRMVNHPSVSSTLKDINLKAGVIYYYFLARGVTIEINNLQIQPIDPLFIEEANVNGNLDENKWDGQTVRWIEKPAELVLDNDFNIKCTIEITQLPYPPIFRVANIPGQSDADIRKRYLIGNGNYGFYVYRNERLIAWATLLDGIIPQDQDLFAFRGRIKIDDTADDYFNIDVKKSFITLSEEAYKSISDFVQEGRFKSQKAWNRAGRAVKDLLNKEPNEVSNNIITQFEQLDYLPGDNIPSEEELTERLKVLDTDMENNVKQMALLLRQDAGDESEVVSELTPEQKVEAVKGSDNPNAQKIFRVPSVIDNLLWEPYYDTDLKNCVRINKLHRFGRYIFEENGDNKDLQVIFELMLLQFAESELYAYKNINKHSYDELKEILTEYRRFTSEFLANMCRRLEGKLPPFKGNNDL